MGVDVARRRRAAELGRQPRLLAVVARIGQRPSPPVARLAAAGQRHDVAHVLVRIGIVGRDPDGLAEIGLGAGGLVHLQQDEAVSVEIEGVVRILLERLRRQAQRLRQQPVLPRPQIGEVVAGHDAAQPGGGDIELLRLRAVADHAPAIVEQEAEPVHGAAIALRRRAHVMARRRLVVAAPESLDAQRVGVLRRGRAGQADE